MAWGWSMDYKQACCTYCWGLTTVKYLKDCWFLCKELNQLRWEEWTREKVTGTHTEISDGGDTGGEVPTTNASAEGLGQLGQSGVAGQAVAIFGLPGKQVSNQSDNLNCEVQGKKKRLRLTPNGRLCQRLDIKVTWD